jgi:hypothetical protein
VLLGVVLPDQELPLAKNTVAARETLNAFATASTSTSPGVTFLLLDHDPKSAMVSTLT